MHTKDFLIYFEHRRLCVLRWHGNFLNYPHGERYNVGFFIADFQASAFFLFLFASQAG
jgi:hypothetical protein